MSGHGQLRLSANTEDWECFTEEKIEEECDRMEKILKPVLESEGYTLLWVSGER